MPINQRQAMHLLARKPKCNAVLGILMSCHTNAVVTMQSFVNRYMGAEMKLLKRNAEKERGL
jgi:hypothetical protein